LVNVDGSYFFVGGAPQGFPFLASIIALFSGAQLFALGVVGEYLARVHFRLMDRPTYAVRAATSNDANDKAVTSRSATTRDVPADTTRS
jgi:undecaprenyl-phosphate 4-deoxy-4-formamido-L-arabinose transferase